MIHMTNGYDPMLAAAGRTEELEQYADELGILHSVAYVTFQELATRVSHRNTGKACNDPVADRIAERITQLGGEPNALQFTRRKALGGPVQAQVR